MADTTDEIAETIARAAEKVVKDLQRTCAGKPILFATKLYVESESSRAVDVMRARRLEKRVAALEKAMQQTPKPRVRVPAGRAK